MRSHAKATSAASTPRRTGIAAVLAVALFLALIVTSSAQAATPTRFAVPDLSQSIPGEFLCGAAVDPAGNLYLGTFGEVKVFDDSGTELTSFASPSVCEVAVDSNGNVYAQAFEGAVTKYNPEVFPPLSGTTYSKDLSVNGTGILDPGPGDPGNGKSLAVDPASDEIYVTRSAAGAGIRAYQPDGTLIDATIGTGVPGAKYSGIDVFGANGHIYVWEDTSKEILIFDPAASLTTPAKTIDPAATPAGAMGSLGGFLALAVDQSSGNVFAFDEANLLVNEFKPSGELVSTISKDFEGNPFATAEPSSLAVDNSEGANGGTLYVATLGKVSAYDLKGHPPIPDLSQSIPGEFLCGAAVDPAGNLYLGTFGEVKVFDDSGTELTSFASPSVCEVAVDSNGNVYAQAFEGAVTKYNPEVFPPLSGTTYSKDLSVNGTGILDPGPGDPGNGKSLAVDPASDEIYVTRSAAGAGIRAYQPDGTLIDATIGTGVPGAKYSGIDVFGANGHIYVWEDTSKEILIFDPAASLTTPAKTIDPAATPAGAMGSLGGFLALAVDQSSGNVFAFDEANLLVNEFKPSGELVSTISKDFEGNPFATAEPSSLAVDNSEGANGGTLYVATLGKVSAYGPLPQTAATLRVKKAGKGTGTITSDPAGIDCGSTCEVELENDTEITLSAAADPGSSFKGWSGCDTVVAGQCKVKMNTDKEVTATFTGRKLTVEKPPSGSGTVTSAPAGINCGATCEAEFADGAAVTLTGGPGPGSVLKWSGCDSVSVENKCTLVMNANRKVTATFAAKPTISGEAAKVHDTSARLEATIDPESEATTYRFQYVDQASFEAEGYLGAPSAPVPAAKLPAGASPVPVFTVIEGLTPGTTYHFRLVAFNSVGESIGPDQTFTTHLTPDPDLPDGRVYEQASPVAKNGLDASGTPRTVRAAPNGDGITFATHSGIPGGEGAPNLPILLAQRGAKSWSTQGIMPPNTEGPSGQVIGWTPDFSHVFSQSRRLEDPVGTKTLLDRSTADGSLTPVVPHTVLGNNNYYFAGTSADGSKVYFESDGPALASGTIGGKDNLYLWNRASKQVSLVGVLPDSACGTPPCVPPGGSFAGPYDWVNGEKALDVGGTKRRYYTQDEHAISDSGERVFFTAGGTGEIYLRSNPAGPSPATVEISASEKENGAGSGGTDGAGTRPKAFMGATPDGSSAFFTSAEKLTDDADTGPEPDGFPAIARAEIDGDPSNTSFLPASSNGPGGVVIEGTHIYWVDAGEGNPGEGKIGRAQLNGDGDASEIEPNFIEGAYNPNGVAVGEGFIYWTNAGDEEDGTGTIGRADINGTLASVDQDCVTGAHNPQGVAVGGGFIYWANSGARKTLQQNPETENKRGIGRAELDCDGATQAFILGEGGSFPRGITLDDTHIYWAGVTKGGAGQLIFSRISRAELDGDDFILNFIELSDSGPEPDPQGIALNGTHLFWTQPGTDSIGRATLDKSEVNKEFITDADSPRGLALDGSHLYWAANQEVLPNLGNDLYRYEEEADEDDHHLTDVSLADGTVSPGTNPNGAEVRGVLGISNDGSRVYFAANGVLTTTPNERGESAALGNCPEDLGLSSGTCNLYFADGDEVDFIARLAMADQVHSDALNWIGTPSGVFAGTIRVEKTARVTPSGGTLLFRSSRRLTDYDNKGKPMFYRYSAEDGELGCVSCDPSGAPPTNALTLSVRTVAITPDDPASTLSRWLSGSGDQVFFESTDALLATDTNGDSGCPVVGSDLQKFSACQDVYMWEAEGSGSCEEDQQGGGCLYLLSTGKSPYPSFLADASASGDDVFFFTRDQLVGQDTDQLYDVYDARVNGGLASQNEAPPVSCEGEGCKPATSAPPTTTSPGSAAFSGPGNPKAGKKPRPRCAKGKRRVRRNGKARCVKRQQRGNRRNAKTTGRAGR